MKKTVLITLICLALAGLPICGYPGNLPVIDGKIAVAAVNGEPITVDEVNKAIAASHMQRSGEERAGRIDYSDILNRLINVKLILFEARNIGLDELPQVRAAIEEYSQETLRRLVLERKVENVRVGEAEVQNGR